jgi:hypothetical protein
MRPLLLAIEVMGTILLMLALAAPPACGQSLGEVTAATGIHGTLARQSTGSSRGALSTVKQSLAKSTAPRDYGFGSSSGSKPASRPTASKSPSGPRPMGSSGTGRGSWVTASSAGRGSASAAWKLGGSGWATGGGGSGRTPVRRPR